MKKLLLSICLGSLLLSSGCATLVARRMDDCQVNQPAPGTPVRKVRMVPFIANMAVPFAVGRLTSLVLFETFPIMVVCEGIDFATNRIYKPCPKPK